MLRSSNLIILFVLVLCGFTSNAQEKPMLDFTDSIQANIDTTQINSETIKRHLPRKATMYSAVLPGLGQIYNKQWWKVPFIYGGFGFLGYEIVTFHKEYYASIVAYQHLKDGDPSTNSYKDFERFPYKDESESNATAGLSWMEQNAENKRDSRDQFIIIAAAFYLFNILDANVSAHFLDFDISEDLTLNLNPNVSQTAFTQTPTPGLTLVYNF